MTESVKDEGQSSAATGKRRTLKTVLFAGVLVAVLGLAFGLSKMDRPPSTPRDSDHMVEQDPPNPVCLECHPPESWPEHHPPVREKRYECNRCHQPVEKGAEQSTG